MQKGAVAAVARWPSSLAVNMMEARLLAVVAGRYRGCDGIESGCVVAVVLLCCGVGSVVGAWCIC